MIYLDIACNDENGRFDHRAHQLQIGDAELEANNWYHPPRSIELDSAIRLSGKTWRIDWSKEWVGNWCWNRYRLISPGYRKTPRWHMVDFCLWLRSRELFHVSTATVVFCEWWRGERELTLAQLHTEICELEDLHGRKP